MCLNQGQMNTYRNVHVGTGFWWICSWYRQGFVLETSEAFSVAELQLD
jgi:hypothetical protein